MIRLQGQAPSTVRGRFAPSPTGYMHLGNAWSFLMAWLSVRKQNGAMLLRIEDIDPDRAKPHYTDAIMYDLAWLGLSWDEGPVAFDVYAGALNDKGRTHSTPITSALNTFQKLEHGHACSMQNPHVQSQYIQSQCSGLYISVLEYLARQGHSYPCFCTRKELRAMAGAPHLGEACVYAGTCRHLTKAEQVQRFAEGRKACIRLRCPDEIITFLDRRCGLQGISLTSCGGDFAIRRSDGVFAYQLAVVIDDMRMGITEIVRGDDLLHCTPRQIFLQSLLRESILSSHGVQRDKLNFLCHHAGTQMPSYLHLPLLLDAEGERFAKRHASLTIQSLRDAGVPAPCVLGYLAYLAGFIDKYEPLSAEELIPYFDVQRLPQSALRLLHDPFQALCDLAHKKDVNMPTALACEPCGTMISPIG